MTVYRIVAVLVIFAGSQFKAAFAWNLSDSLMDIMKPLTPSPYKKVNFRKHMRKSK